MSKLQDDLNKFQNLNQPKKGGFRKIVDSKDTKQTCLHPSHNPPMFMVLEEGIWEYTCPNCGKTQIINVYKPTF